MQAKTQELEDVITAIQADMEANQQQINTTNSTPPITIASAKPPESSSQPKAPSPFVASHGSGISGFSSSTLSPFAPGPPL
eukprot:7408689-Karenia_brevis.AAC.1